MQSPYQIALSGQEQAVLAARTRSARGPYRDRLRAAIVLAAAAGQANAAIAAELGICTDTVRKWRRRFAEGRLAGLKDAPRSGRPPAFTATDRAEAVALACALPAESGVPLSRWSGPDLARELAARRGIAASASTVRRWLAGDALKPWQHRSWISVRDPQFAIRAARVLDLYAGIWDGRPLGGNDYVICADEKTSIQARCRCHPTLPPGKARAMRIEHDYDRRGALAYLAAWDVRRGRVTGRCEDTTGIAPFARLVAQVMSTEPYASADRVFWITDNGSSHRGAASVQRMATAWPNARLIHLPAHASWLDQAEIYFSVIQRKVLTPNDFTGLDQIRGRLAAFETRYNAIARPFDWKFTSTDLSDLLRRIDTHVNAEAHALAA
ncbi:MAG TPA: IS630 family transposase [Streptosporangiaceae bacterium]|nr:IS630 family transposase [Streptosporangiaceae bacterium]